MNESYAHILCLDTQIFLCCRLIASCHQPWLHLQCTSGFFFKLFICDSTEITHWFKKRERSSIPENVKSLSMVYTVKSKVWMTFALWEETMKTLNKKCCSEKREVVFITNNSPEVKGFKSHQDCLYTQWKDIAATAWSSCHLKL